MSRHRFRVATYNVHKCRGMDGRVRADRIANVLREVDADIIALQEVLSIPDHTREANQAVYLAEELGFQCALGEVRKLAGGAYGNVVLSRFPLRSFCQFDLSVGSREERGCIRSDVILSDALTLHVFNVHLGTAFMERRHQARKLITSELLRSELLVGPRIVLGDFNEWVRGLVTRLLRSHLESADIKLHLRSSRTYPGFLPFMHLDHIYHDTVLKLQKLALHRSRIALVASDHLPLVAEFSLEEAEIPGTPHLSGTGTSISKIETP